MKSDVKAAITVTIPRDVKITLRKLAESKGLAVASYVKMLIAQDLIKHNLR